MTSVGSGQGNKSDHPENLAADFFPKPYTAEQLLHGVAQHLPGRSTST